MILFKPCLNLFNVIQWNCIQIKRGPTKEVLLKGVFIPKLVNNPLPSCCLVNFDFLLSHTAHFDRSIILPIFVYSTFGFLLSVFFLYFKQTDNIVLKLYISLINFWVWSKTSWSETLAALAARATSEGQIKSSNFLILLSFLHILLAHCLLKQIHHD